MINSLQINKSPANTKVVVAMSGGVDSSAVAALLKEQGYDVIGITLQLYDHGKIEPPSLANANSLPLNRGNIPQVARNKTCCAGADILDAKKVAEQFDFPHYVLNYESLFRDSVIDDFADSYIRGETPIPCVRCNQSVKFKDLLKVAKDLNADILATGHYVQRKIDNEGISRLCKGFDEGKDQSYFLFTTTRDQLDFLRFPLGGWTKEQTRAQAVRLGLEIADKPDSQDICFVPDGDYAKVIAKLRPSAFKKGEIVNLDGKILGEHNGIINYTIGQRRGLGISSPDPLYVVKIDAKNNQVIVGSEENLQKQELRVKELNWLGGENMSNPLLAKVRLRSSQKEIEAKIWINQSDKTAKVELFSPTRSITPGQACVIYDEEVVLGGGWIVNDDL